MWYRSAALLAAISRWIARELAYWELTLQCNSDTKCQTRSGSETIHATNTTHSSPRSMAGVRKMIDIDKPNKDTDYRDDLHTKQQQQPQQRQHRHDYSCMLYINKAIKCTSKFFSSRRRSSDYLTVHDCGYEGSLTTRTAATN